MILAASAIWLAYETKSVLIGERANTPVVEGIRRSARNTKYVDQVNEVATMHMGPDYVLVNMSLDFSGVIDAIQIKQSETAMTESIKQQYLIVNESL